MNWVEQDMSTRANVNVDAEKAQLLDKVKKESLPVITKEAEQGAKGFEKVSFQPVLGTNIYEAEFGMKKEDIIFHFWPWGYHEAERKGERTPSFDGAFEVMLKASIEKVFHANRCELTNDADVGAWAVRAIGYAKDPFARDLAVKLCEQVYNRMGGI